jgi:asparagine synthase (glutamine-hydrolysing)
MEGELFDTTTLRRKLTDTGYPATQASDPELALYLFEHEGVEGFFQIHGIFALAVWDGQRQQLILANDRFGLRPLYYTHRPGLFAFAGEIKGLLALEDVNREMDHDAVADFFAFGHVLGNKTLLRDVHLLPPATVLTVCNSTVRQQTYWSLEYAPISSGRSMEAWVDETTHLLSQAVARRLKSRCAVGLPLSGGFDSCTLLAVASQMLETTLPTYTYGFPGSQEIRRARQVAHMFGAPHRALYLKEDYLSAYAQLAVRRAEGLLNCLSSHGFALQGMAPECQVMMLGNGGDTLLDAFRSYRPQLLAMQQDMVSDYFQITNDLFSEQQASRLFSATYYTQVKGRAFASLEASLVGLTPNSVDNIYDAHRLREFNRRSVLQGLFTVNHYLEYSEPYYDYDLVDFALHIPTDLRWNRKIQKLVLARISPPLADLLTSSPGKLRRLRRRFLPRRQTLKRLLGPLGTTRQSRLIRGAHSSSALSHLLRTADREWSEELLLSPRTLERGYFRPQAVRQLVQDHMSGQRHLSRQLGALITFELWQRCFLD